MAETPESTNSSSSTGRANGNQQPDLKGSFTAFMSDVWAFFHDLIDLQDGLAKRQTITNIKNNKRMKGANAWLLMCSIMIASIGLDLNSPAVIIGAMLISPLMSPILGIGLAVGINDRATLKISMQHFGIAIAIALVTSTFYFSITPFGNMTPEIFGRTKPTLLDVLVAAFGGIAGIISGSRKDQSNAIPGVAIATALMPPLCVTGFGIANGLWEVMLNSFYLFFLNSFFVALATYIIVRFLRFPMRKHENEKERKRARWMIMITSILIIIPSIYILMGVLQKVRTDNNVKQFLTEYYGEKKKYIDNYELVRRDSFNQLIIKVYGTEINYDDIPKMEEGLKKYNLENTRIEIIPTTEVDLEQYNELAAEISGFKNIAAQLEIAKNTRSEKDQQIADLEAKLDSIARDTVPFTAVSQEAKVLFPELEKVVIAKAKSTDFQKKADDIPYVLVQWNDKKRNSTLNEDESKLSRWIEKRIGLDTIELVRIR